MFLTCGCDTSYEMLSGVSGVQWNWIHHNSLVFSRFTHSEPIDECIY